MRTSLLVLISALTGTLLAVAGENPGAPLPVELNGIANFFGVKQAFFILEPPASGNFALSLGETKNGIKLIAIDAATGLVKIESRGQQRLLHICRTPNLMDFTARSAANQAVTGKPYFNGYIVVNDNEVFDFSEIGNPIYGTLPPLVGGSSGLKEIPSPTPAVDNAPSSNTTPPSPADVNGPNPAEQLKSSANEDWYQEAMNIEENRQNSIQDVLAGKMTPYPLTPLTPAGTPANLISKDGLFWNHMPDFLNRSLPGDLSASR